MDNKKMSRGLLIVPAVIVIGLIGLVLWKGLSQNESATQTGKIKVVASLDSYGEMAQAVLGNQGSVASVLSKASIDPHDFEPTADTAKLYQQADVIISNGGGYDAWSLKFAKANEKAVSVNVASLYNYKDGDNEHFWYHTDVAEKLTSKLVKTYSKLEPNKADYFKKNADKYLAAMSQLTKLRDELKSEMANKNVMATEPVFDNTLTALGVNILDQSFSKAVDEGQDPTPAAVRDWQTEIDEGKVAVIIKNSQSGGKLVDQAVAYAQDHDVPVVEVTETKPDGETYVEWQMNQLQALAEAVK